MHICSFLRLHFHPCISSEEHVRRLVVTNELSLSCVDMVSARKIWYIGLTEMRRCGSTTLKMKAVEDNHKRQPKRIIDVADTEQFLQIIHK